MSMNFFPCVSSISIPPQTLNSNRPWSRLNDTSYSFTVLSMNFPFTLSDIQTVIITIKSPLFSYSALALSSPYIPTSGSTPILQNDDVLTHTQLGRKKELGCSSGDLHEALEFRGGCLIVKYDYGGNFVFLVFWKALHGLWNMTT